MSSLKTTLSILFLIFLFTSEITGASLRRRRNDPANELNLRPIIGILTQPTKVGPESKRPKVEKALNFTYTLFSSDPKVDSYDEYIAASYIKFVETAGARVVAIRYNQTKHQLKKIFRKINGVLIPGGGVDLTPGTPFYEAGVSLWEYLNEEDPYFPVFGTCLGFELIACLATGSNQVLIDSGKFNASNSSWPISFTSAARASRLYHNLNEYLFSALSTEGLTYNEHSQGITPSVFEKYNNLYSNYNILSNGYDSNGKEFISAFEHKKYNIFAVQYHPEKSVFEWYLPVNIPHEIASIKLAQTLADVFVDKARHNFNSFELSPDIEAKLIIQNHQHLFLGNQYFQEMWVFKNEEPQWSIDIEPNNTKDKIVLEEFKEEEEDELKEYFNYFSSLFK